MIPLYTKSTHPSGSSKRTIRISLRPLSPAVWLSYTLFTDDGEKIRIVYSVRITKHMLGCRTKETVTLPDISASEVFAKRIFRLLVKGRVTPYAADEVMESILE